MTDENVIRERESSHRMLSQDEQEAVVGGAPDKEFYHRDAKWLLCSSRDTITCEKCGHAMYKYFCGRFRIHLYRCENPDCHALKGL